MRREENIFGVMAEFEDMSELHRAIEAARTEGYRALEAYTPAPNEEISHALGHKKSPLPLIVLLGGLAGGLLGYGLQAYLLGVAYPLNVGGRPLNSWPYFVPITFECIVLFAAFSAVIGLFAVCGLPLPHHPAFYAEGFERASQDRCFLCVEARDEKFDSAKITEFFHRIGARNVSVVPC